MGKSLCIDIKGWADIRRKILARDGYVCRVCGKDACEVSLNVHHIDYSRRNNKDSNLVTLCPVCHRGVHKEQYKPCDYEDWPIPWGEHP